VQYLNKWKHESRELQIPLLPAGLQGSSGCVLARAIFDEEIGIEVYLAILEEPSWCLPLAATRPFKVFCKSGLAQTGNGGIIFLIWRIAGESNNEVVHEQYLNPDKINTIRDLSALAQQTHLKALVINSRASEVVDWFEFENDFKFDELLRSAVEMIGRIPAGNFSAAIEELTKRYSLEDLSKA
jgi:hypothetical protein